MNIPRQAMGSIKIGDTLNLTGYDKELQTDARSDRLTSAVYVVEKGKPYTYTAIGESVVLCYRRYAPYYYPLDYLFSGNVGEYILED